MSQCKRCTGGACPGYKLKKSGHKSAVICESCNHSLNYHVIPFEMEGSVTREAEQWMGAKSRWPLFVSTLPKVDVDVLPREIQVHIASYLSVGQLCNTVTKLNRHWRGVAEDDTIWNLFIPKLKKREKQEENETLKQYYLRMKHCDHCEYHETVEEYQRGAYSSTRVYKCPHCDKVLWSYTCDAWENDTTEIGDAMWYAKHVKQ